MTRNAAITWALCFASTAAAQVKEPDAPIPAREAPLRMTVPDGFKVTLFAGEPDVVQPIAFTFDDRGRLWVVENFSYPKWNKEIATEKGDGGRVLDRRKGKDRVVIFEDTDGDGVHDKRTVFADNLTNVSGIEYGFGGIWLCSIPNLLYIPIAGAGNGDRHLFVLKKVPVPVSDKPAGPPEIKLDGWSLQSGHNAFNSLKWGPDGWLYGCNGILATSLVGAPGTPEKERTPMNCGVWRYHPTKKKFEVFAHGTTNPWGLDWDQYGELFITNCVIDHVWHVVQGGHYERMYGQDFNPHLYKLMPSIADHKHWAGGNWTESRGGKGAHSDAGGGHAHVGCMIYQGDNWPAKYRNTLFTLNLHGNRINNDILERKGSSYVARHGKDFLLANDPWFRGLGIDYGPDGGVYVSDWCDTGECHNYQVAHTTTGRIYKIVHGQPKAWRGDLAKLTDKELVELQGHRNEWFVRHSRRLLQERMTANREIAKALGGIPEIKESAISQTAALRSLWLRNLADGVAGDELARIIKDSPHESVRAWAVRLALEVPRNDPPRIIQQHPTDVDKAIITAAARDKSPLVRLMSAGGMQRMPHHFVPQFARFVGYLASDADDAFLPLMFWYAVEHAAQGDEASALSVMLETKVPLVRQYAARRFASTSNKDLFDYMFPFLLNIDLDASVHRDILLGIRQALKGQRHHDMPKYWPKLYPILAESKLPEVRSAALELAVLFGDQQAIGSAKQLVIDTKKPLEQRQSALQTLVTIQPSVLAASLHQLLDDPPMRASALQALAVYADPKTPSLILQRYPKLTPDEKSDAVHTLASRPAYALALLDAVADKTVARTDLSAFTVRQLLALNDKKVTARVNEVWGTLRPASQEKAALMAKYKNLLTAETLRQANLANGRQLYSKQCASCHKLFGEGGAIGPELTGSQRTNLDYVLENMLDPSAVVPREYQVQIVVTDSGRTLTGIVKEETERAVTIQTQNEVVIVPKSEIDSRRSSNLSMMPEGMLDRLTADEVRDLVAYLAKQP